MEKFRLNSEKPTAQSDIVFSYPVHTHTYCEMTLYFPFNGNISVNNQNFYIDNITAILVKPFDFHKIDVENNHSAKYIKISFDESCLVKGNIPTNSMYAANIANDDFLLMLFNDAYEHRNETLYFQALINAVVFRISKDGKSISAAPESGKYHVVTEAIRIINEFFRSDITLQSVAKEIYVTPQYLSRVFKEEIGMGFSEYVIRARLNLAESLLNETSYSVTQICFSCGYKNLSHFLRSFKKEYGLSPNAYRKHKNF